VDNWVDTDLTELTGGKPLAGPASSGKHLVALLTTPNNQRHVYFAAKSGDLEQLYFNGSSWSKQNLTANDSRPRRRYRQLRLLDGRLRCKQRPVRLLRLP
jgi:hypothetical protein